MAELSYSDMQRAVQEGTRDVRDLVNRMWQQVQRFDLIEQQIITLRREVDFVRRQSLSINTQLVGLAKPVATNGLDQRIWQQLGNSLHAVDARLIVMQKYLQDVSDFIVLSKDKNTEEQHFKGA